MRTHGKIDANQPDIVKALRRAGATVKIMSNLGDGFPDIGVGFRGKNFLMEVKDGKNDLTQDQREFFDTWRGQVVVVRSPADALRVINS